MSWLPNNKEEKVRFKSRVSAGATLAGAFVVAATLTVPSPSGAVAEIDERPAVELMRETVEGNGQRPELGEEMLQDLRTLAAKNGSDLSELIRVHTGSVEVATLTTSLEATHSETYVVSGLTQPSAPYRYWIAFTEKPGPEIFEQIRSLPVDVEVRWGAPASMRTIEALCMSAAEVFEKHPDVIAAAMCGGNPDGVSLDVRYGVSEQADSVRVGNVLDVAIDRIKADAADGIERALRINAIAEDDLANYSDYTTVQGGRSMRVGGAHDCTAGFTVERAGWDGVITAGH